MNFSAAAVVLALADPGAAAVPAAQEVPAVAAPQTPAAVQPAKVRFVHQAVVQGEVQQPVEAPADSGQAPAEAPASQEQAAQAPAIPPSEVSVPTAQGNEIVVTGEAGPPPEDPIEAVNIQTFEVVQEVDNAIVGPIADAYKAATPKPLRQGIDNFLLNLREPIVFLNFLLQGKPGKAVETLGRFVVNSTIGVAGIVDVAKEEPFNLPRRRNGFANTLGYYGVDTGAYLYLPLIGPTTVRDLIGRTVDFSILPFAVGKPFNDPYYQIPTTTISALNERVAMEEDLEYLKEESPNAYASVRDYYLRSRQAEIDSLHGINGTPGLPDPVPLDPIAGDMPTYER